MSDKERKMTPERIKKIREKLDESAFRFCSRLAVTPEAVRKWEGDTKSASPPGATAEIVLELYEYALGIQPISEGPAKQLLDLLQQRFAEKANGSRKRRPAPVAG